MKTVKNLIFTIVVISFALMQDASLQITNYSAEINQLEISMTNSENVGGFQLQLESSFADFSVISFWDNHISWNCSCCNCFERGTMNVIPYKNEKYFKQVLHSMESFVLFFFAGSCFCQQSFQRRKNVL